MNQSQKGASSFSSVIFPLALALLLTSCGGGNGDVGIPNDSLSSTTISGKVTLSSTVTAKPTMMAAMLSKARMEKAGIASKPVSGQETLLKTLSATTLSAPTAFLGADVELYDADRPAWLLPVATATTSSSDGTYTLGTLVNASSNLNDDGSAAYVDGNPVPVGNYTVIASKTDVEGNLFVAVQAVVKKFSGSVTGNDLVAQDSDAVPSVISILGLSRNEDGTFGSSTTPVPVNANIQVTFSMAMNRQSVIAGVKLVEAGQATPVVGKWRVSPDLTAATFYPTADMKPNTVYNVTVGGGKSLYTVKNIYEKPVAADVKGSFRTAPADTTPPTALRKSPGSKQKSNMPYMTPIRIGVDEELDITSIDISSTPSIGDKPAVKFVGRSRAVADTDYPYIYEIVPSVPLQLGTTYTLTVSGGLDMVGLPMDVLTASFNTEATTAGVTGTTASEIEAQLAVKTVLGKWINAMNARNSGLLSSYMSGDFYWVNDTSRGMSREDLNRDGRLSLNEFTAMLNNWFKELDRCGSIVTGDVDAANANVSGGIKLNGSSAEIAFTITAKPTNTTDSTCDTGPNNTLYAVMENINQAWIMTRGSDFYLPTFPPGLTLIDLLSPANGNQFAEPSPVLNPEFKWTAVASAGTPMATYMVVLIDNRSRQLQTGWVALVDGTSTSVGSPVVAKFNGKPGDYGNMIVIDTGGSGGDSPLGFNKMINEIKPGGSYSWAVIGFKTKTISDFKLLNFDPGLYLAASSANNGFTVNGVWKELAVKVTGATGTVYSYSDSSGGYNVGTESSVTMTITAPYDPLTPTAHVDGYTSKDYPLTFGLVNGAYTATQAITLSNKRNWVNVSELNGLSTDFGIFTTGGTPPKIAFNPITAKTCPPAAVAATSWAGPNGWDNYTSSDACTVSISGTVDPSLTGSLYLNVWNGKGNGRYSAQITPIGGAFSAIDIPVYNGQNWVSIGHWAPLEIDQNGFGVDTQAGSTYNKPILATVDIGGVPLTATMEDIDKSFWDAGAASSVTLNVTMPYNAVNGTYQIFSDPNFAPQGTGTIVGTALNSITVNLIKGWNYILLNDDVAVGNEYTVIINAPNGTPFTLPNYVTSVTDGTTTLPISAPSYAYYPYSSAACSVTINGTTTSALPMNVYLNYYNSTTYDSVSEWQTVTPTAGNYTITQPVYGGGLNTIDIFDGDWKWQGVQVTAASCAAPVVFSVTNVKDESGADLIPDMYGSYNATTPTVTVSGTAKAGSSITAYVSGMYYKTATTAAGGFNTFLLPIPVYTGYNQISLTDERNWTYLNVNTTTGSAYVPPINSVTVTGSTQSGGTSSDAWSSWSTSLGTVDITGTATAPGSGSWSQSGAYYASGTFTGGGAFTLTGVTLGYGYNDFTLYDANWNPYYLSIYSSGGVGAPAKIVSITSPAQNDTAGGATSVTGKVDTASFSPTYVYGYVYDNVTGLSKYYSNQAADYTGTASWAQPLTYDVATGKVTFSTTVTSPNSTYIQVYAYDSSLTTSHGHGIYVNNNTAGNADYFWKPGSKPSASAARAKAHETEFLKRMLRR